MSLPTLRQRRERLTPEWIQSALLTGFGAVGLLTGLISTVMACGQAGGAWCAEANGGLLGGGLSTTAASALVLIGGAVWLGAVNRSRRQMDRALERARLSVAPTRGGVMLLCRGAF